MQKTGNVCGLVIIVVLFVTGCIAACGCMSQAPAGGSGTGVEVPATDADLRIITEELPPLSTAGPDGKATGQATEVVTGILSRLNQKAEIEILPWDKGYAAALAGPKVALYSTGRTGEREHLFKWVGPISMFDYVLYGRNGSAPAIDSLEAAKKAGTIAVVRDDARHQFLLANNFSNLATCDAESACLRMLEDGRADLWLGSTATSVGVAGEAGVDPAAFVTVYSVRTVPLYIAFSPDTPDSVVAAWQDALDAMKRDGTYTAIRQKYGMSAAPAASLSGSADEQADLALYAIIAGIDSRLTSVLRTYEVLAITPELKAARWEPVKPLLAVIESHEPDIRTWYANPDGSYYTVVDGLTTQSLKDRTYFPVVLAGNESVGTVVVSHTTGRNTAIVAVPVMEDRTVTGILGASVYLDNLTDQLNQEIKDPFVFYAIDREGRFALHSEKGQISRDIATVGTATSFGNALQAIRVRESGEVSYEDGGVSYQARFRTSPLTGWRFVVAWPVTG